MIVGHGERRQGEYSYPLLNFSNGGRSGSGWQLAGIYAALEQPVLRIFSFAGLVEPRGDARGGSRHLECPAQPEMECGLPPPPSFTAATIM